MKMKIKMFKSTFAMSLLSISVSIYSDDTDIYKYESKTPSNILFVMDMSKSMDFEADRDEWATNIEDTRNAILKRAFSRVLNDPDMVDVNIGVSTFSGENAGMGEHTVAHGITYPISPIDGPAIDVLNSNPLFTHKGTSYLPVDGGRTTRGYIGTAITSTWVNPNGGTPLVDALYEAALYFRGADVDHGRFEPLSTKSAHPSTYTGLITRATRHPTRPATTPHGHAVYKSPIKDECARNAIVLLTDGAATTLFDDQKINSMIGPDYADECSISKNPMRPDYTACGVELAEFLANEDQNTATVDGVQNVNTYTIGFSLVGDAGIAAEQFLKKVARKGGGKYFKANDTDGLVDAFKEAVLTVKNGAGSFASPTYTTHNVSSVSHSDTVYLPVFKLGGGPVWSGNLKKFRRTGGIFYDSDGLVATSSDGVLLDEAQDYWALDHEGSGDDEEERDDAVLSGGFANMIDSAKRISGATPIYTDNGSALVTLNKDLSVSLFEKASDSFTSEHRNNLVDFILGKNTDGSERHHMGDILHSKPVHLSYGDKSVVFVGTNEGYLHAIDESDGSEVFSYMPKELLKNIDTQFRNSAIDKHVYGVDGPMTLWHEDTNKNNIVDHGEKAVLYFGLRRGGKSYYALDVSNRTSPSLKWKIDNTTGQFNNLGFTWSQPTVSKMRYGGSTSLRPVLVFGGGYIDDNGDLGAVEVDGSTSTGSEVYIVDADTGSMIWKTSDASGLPTDATKYAKPAKIRVIDVNRDGSLDRLYHSDTGGNVWRVDFSKNNVSDAKVMHFARLGGSSSTDRKFFTEPDVAIFKKGAGIMASVAIGSGERPNPTGSSRDDHFFVLFDKQILTTPAVTPSVITMTDLLDATSSTKVNVFTANKKGWYIDLVEIGAEKVLSSSITYQNTVYFSSFGVESSSSADACTIGQRSKGRLYALDLLSSEAVLEFGGVKKRSTNSTTNEIPETPQIIFNAPSSKNGGNCTSSDCVRKKEVSIGKGRAIGIPTVDELQKVYWIDED